jgi:hypothetical protein
MAEKARQGDARMVGNHGGAKPDQANGGVRGETRKADTARRGEGMEADAA